MIAPEVFDATDPPRATAHVPRWRPARCITDWSRSPSSSCTPGATRRQLTFADIEEMRRERRARRRPGAGRDLGGLGPAARHRCGSRHPYRVIAALREGQLPTAVLVARYRIGCARCAMS